MAETDDDDSETLDEDMQPPSGLVAMGGTLDPDFLIQAYRAGMFPWSSDPVITWWSPDPRAIFDLESYRPHRSTLKRIRSAGWRFAAVATARMRPAMLGVNACAARNVVTDSRPSYQDAEM